MKENTFLDKFSLYFFMSSLAIGLVMSVAFVVNLKVDEANQTDKLENLSKERVSEMANTESVNTIYVIDQVDLTQVKEITNEVGNVTAFKTIEEVYPLFENQTDAILVVNKPIQNLDANVNFISFESVNNKVTTYYYFHSKAPSTASKATKFNLTPRKSIPSANEVIG